jgi:hypothetical protein
VAVGTVLLYHVGVPFARGGYVGVDVFFVISGFLITGLLVRELEKTDGISLSRFYSRRAKRLLPLTVVVLAFVVLVALALPLYDPVRMEELSLGVVASALYVMNWLLGQLLERQVSALLLGEPLEVLDDLRHLHAQGHRKVFRRVELFPVPFFDERPYGASPIVQTRPSQVDVDSPMIINRLRFRHASCSEH